MTISKLSNHTALFASFFYDNPEPMWLYARDSFRFLAVNNAAKTKYGYSETEFLQLTIFDIRPQEDVAPLKQTLNPLVLGCKKAGVWRHLTKAGDVLYVDITSHLTDIDGTQAVMVCARDVTEQVRLQRENAALLTAEKVQRAQLEQSARLLAIASRTGRFGGWRVDLTSMQVEWSEQTALIHGYPAAKVLSLDECMNFYAAPYRPLVKERFNRCVIYGESFDDVFQIIDLHGNCIWVRAIGEPEYSKDGHICAVHGAFQDVDELINTKDQLADVQRSLYQTLEQISDAFFLLDHDWCFVFLNNKAEQLLRQPRSELLGKNVWHCFPDAVGTLFQLQYQRAVSNNITVQFDAFFAPLETHFAVTAYPTQNGLAVYFEDITAQKQLSEQLERSASLQQQAQHLDAIAKLTGGIAHDFNNLLTVIISNTELLYDKLGHQPDALKSAQLCMLAAQKAANLTRHLLAFGRKQVLKPRKVTLQQLIDGAMPLLTHALSEHITMHYLPPVLEASLHIDTEQFALAMLNIVLNAQDAMPTGGQLDIYTEPVAESMLAQHLSTADGEYILIKIADNGPGMTAQAQQKAFEPFFTTKAHGEGFGLGLSFVYGFTQQSGGTAFIDTHYTKGCCICLLLPIKVKGQPVMATLPQKDKTQLLLVEDDILLQQHLNHLLTHQGYQVTAVRSADEGMLLLKQQQFDILLSDIVTPGKEDGNVLAKTAKAEYPKIKVLLTSGFNVMVHSDLAQSFPFIAKPFTTADLLAKLSAL